MFKDDFTKRVENLALPLSACLDLLLVFDVLFATSRQLA